MNDGRENNTILYFIVAGRKCSIEEYFKKNPLKNNEVWKRCRKKEDIFTITVNDKIILLKGWWQYDKIVNEIRIINKNFPNMIEFEDGDYGKEWREKNWKSEEVYGKFDMLVLE